MVEVRAAARAIDTAQRSIAAATQGPRARRAQPRRREEEVRERDDDVVPGRADPERPHHGADDRAAGDRGLPQGRRGVAQRRSATSWTGRASASRGCPTPTPPANGACRGRHAAQVTRRPPPPAASGAGRSPRRGRIVGTFFTPSETFAALARAPDVVAAARSLDGVLASRSSPSLMPKIDIERTIRADASRSGGQTVSDDRIAVDRRARRRRFGPDLRLAVFGALRRC